MGKRERRERRVREAEDNGEEKLLKSRKSEKFKLATKRERKRSEQEK